ARLRATDLVEARSLPLADRATGALPRDSGRDERRQLLAERAAVLHPRERSERPARAGAHGARALLDHAEEALGVQLVHAGSGEPALRERQERVEHERLRHHLLAVEPRHARAEALARSGVEVGARVVELDARLAVFHR